MEGLHCFFLWPRQVIELTGWQRRTWKNLKASVCWDQACEAGRGTAGGRLWLFVDAWLSSTPTLCLLIESLIVMWVYYLLVPYVCSYRSGSFCTMWFTTQQQTQGQNISRFQTGNAADDWGWQVEWDKLTVWQAERWWIGESGGLTGRQAAKLTNGCTMGDLWGGKLIKGLKK